MKYVEQTDQFVSKDDAKKLYDLGFPQNTDFYWKEDYGYNKDLREEWHRWDIMPKVHMCCINADRQRVYAAPTFEELKEFAEKDINIEGLDFAESTLAVIKFLEKSPIIT